MRADCCDSRRENVHSSLSCTTEPSDRYTGREGDKVQFCCLLKAARLTSECTKLSPSRYFINTLFIGICPVLRNKAKTSNYSRNAIQWGISLLSFHALCFVTSTLTIRPNPLVTHAYAAKCVADINRQCKRSKLILTIHAETALSHFQGCPCRQSRTYHLSSRQETDRAQRKENTNSPADALPSCH